MSWKRYSRMCVLIAGTSFLVGFVTPTIDFAVTQPSVKIFMNDLEVSMYDQEVKKEIPGIIYKNRTLVPLKKTFELFGLDLKWSSKDQIIESQTATGKKIWLQISNSQAKVDGKTVILDVPATVINNRTYVPLAFIGKAVGSTPAWDNVNRKVDIYTDGTSDLKLSSMPKAYGSPVRVNSTINFLASDQRRLTISKVKGDLYDGVEMMANALFVNTSNFSLVYETESIKIAVYMDEFMGQSRANMIGSFNGNTFAFEVRGESKAAAVDLVKNLLK